MLMCLRGTDVGSDLRDRWVKSTWAAQLPKSFSCVGVDDRLRQVDLPTFRSRWSGEQNCFKLHRVGTARPTNVCTLVSPRLDEYQAISVRPRLPQAASM